MGLCAKPVPPPRVDKEGRALQLVGAKKRSGQQHHGTEWGHGSLYVCGAKTVAVVGPGRLAYEDATGGRQSSQQGHGHLWVDSCGQESRGASVGDQNPQVMERKSSS